MAGINKTNFTKYDLRAQNLGRSFHVLLTGEGDINADVFGVDLYADKQPVSLSNCSCVGYFIRADGTTVVINGTIQGNRVYVVLPESCYAVEGTFTLTIKVTASGAACTVRMIDGQVVNVTTAEVVDPGSVIPSVSDLLTTLSQIETATETLEGYAIEGVLITGTRYKIKVTLPA